MGGGGSKEDDKKDDKEEDKKPVNHLKELEKKRLREIQTPNQGLQAACIAGDVDAVRKYVAPTDANGRPLEGGGADVNHRDLGPVPPEGKGPDDPEYKAIMKDAIITEDYPLHMAAENGHVKVCELLFYLDAKLENRNRMGCTALHRAVSHQKIDVVKWLLEKKCDIMAKNNIGNYPLHVAAYTGNVDIARLLLEAGAHRQIRTANRVEMTPLDYARKPAMIDLLTRWRPDGSWGDSKSVHDSKSHELKHGESMDTVSDPIPLVPAKHARTNSGSTSNSSVAISVLSEGGFPMVAATPVGSSFPLSSRPASNAPSPLPSYLHPSHNIKATISSDTLTISATSAASSSVAISLPGASDSATTTSSRGATTSTPLYMAT